MTSAHAYTVRGNILHKGTQTSHDIERKRQECLVYF